jgi:hypothetical protein
MPPTDPLLDLARARYSLLKNYREARAGRRLSHQQLCDADRLASELCDIEDRMMAMQPLSITGAIAQLALLRQHTAFDDLGPQDVRTFDAIIAGLTEIMIRDGES